MSRCVCDHNIRFHIHNNILRCYATWPEYRNFSFIDRYTIAEIRFHYIRNTNCFRIANLYAMSPNWSDESALNKCTYFAVIDKLQRAKQVDPSVAEEANSLIGRYSGHTPQAKDLFMLGYKQGDRITIGGWIGETTTIR